MGQPRASLEILCASVVVFASIQVALCVQKRNVPVEKVSDCMYMTSDDGYLEVESHQQGVDATCGIYIIKSPDEVVEVEIDTMDVACDAGGLINLIDGWEMNGQFFPSEADHPLAMSKRFKELCGQSKGVEPSAAMVTNQNAALISYRVPTKGDKFRVKIKGIKNPSPCNVLLDSGEGVFLLQNNNGERSNCSVTSIFPADVQVLETDFVAKRSPFPGVAAGPINGRASLIHLLANPRAARSQHAGDQQADTDKECVETGDYLDIKGGSGLDSDTMQSFKTFCSKDAVKAGAKLGEPYEASVLCGSTTVRLASSGRSYNTVKFVVKAIPLDNPESIPAFKGDNFFCPMEI